MEPNQQRQVRSKSFDHQTPHFDHNEKQFKCSKCGHDINKIN